MPAAAKRDANSSSAPASNGFRRTPSACTRATRFLIHQFERAHRQDHARAAEFRAGLDVLAQRQAGIALQPDIGQNQLRPHILQAQQRRVAIGDGDYPVSFFAQDALAHALGVRAMFGQQNSRHYCGIAGVPLGEGGVGMLEAGATAPSFGNVVTSFAAAASFSAGVCFCCFSNCFIRSLRCFLVSTNG